MTHDISQNQVVSMIDNYMAQHMRPPTEEEIARSFGVSVTCTKLRIREAVEEGLLVRLRPIEGRTHSARSYVPRWYFESVSNASLEQKLEPDVQEQVRQRMYELRKVE